MRKKAFALVIILLLLNASISFASFCGYLKQSTNATIVLGPFLDSTDGDTAETSLTISQADVRLSKNGGNIAQKSQTSSCTHDELGYYNCSLNISDTNTLGRLRIIVHKLGALIVDATFQIVTANVFDTWHSTDVLQTDIIQMGGVPQSATDLKDFVDNGFDPTSNGVLLQDGVGTGQIDLDSGTVLLRSATETQIDNIETDTGTTLENHLTDIKGTGFAKDTHSLPQCLTATGFSTHSAADSADAVWDEAKAGHTTGNTFGGDALDNDTWTDAKAGYLDEAISGIDDNPWDAVTRSLTDKAGFTISGTTQTLDALSTHGDLNWVTASGFSTHGAADIWSVGTRALTDKAGFSLSAAGIDSIWDEALAGHVTGDTPGKVLNMLTQDTVTLSSDVALGSIIGQICDDGTVWSYDRTADALEVGGGSCPTSGQIADAVWDEAKAGHTTGNTFGGDALDNDIWSDTKAGYLDEAISGIDDNPWDAVTRSLTDKAGFTISGTTQTLDALSTHGDLNWVTASGFSTHGAADIWSVGTRALTDKAGFSLSAAGIDSIIDEEVDNDGTAISLRGATKLILSVLTGKSSGGGTATLIFRDLGDTKNRITATVTDVGNRTAVTRDAQ